ncbi:hypothetical protein LCY76_19010 [Fictibacillus sp. KIGAM418]|uniref:Uncharacterized protein n=1 Tax=Fictibacillus marinisediminis TaxID=2878389 RepID=A0A9X1XD58_9BACL|nr:hypothetical protein [Fictibacillus marinisediminis]MCK6258662.1 hypothetical protein [Fictibacillus marinisediminis]
MIFDKQKYRMQAEMLDWYSHKVNELMQKLDQLRWDRNRVLTNADTWESKSKATYLQIMSEAASTHFASASIGEQLKEALKREAARLREMANEMERQEKLDEPNQRQAR